MPTVHSLNIGIKANAKQAEGVLRRFSKQLLSWKGLLAGGVAGYGIYQFASSIWEAGEALDAASKQARILGVSLNDVLQAKFFAQLSGTSLDVYFKAMQRMKRGLDEANSANKVFVEGLDTAELFAMNSTKQFGVLADYLDGLENNVRKNAEAQRIFGKAGAELLPMMEGGAATIKNLADQYTYLAGTIADTVGTRVETANDMLTKLQQQWEAIKISIAGAVIPVLGQLANAFIPLIKSIRDLFTSPSFDVTAFVEPVVEGLASIVYALEDTRRSALALAQVWEAVKIGATFGLYGFWSDMGELQEEMDKIEKRRADREAAGEDFMSRFRQNVAEWRRLQEGGQAEASRAAAASAAVIGAGTGSQFLQQGTVEAATQALRLQLGIGDMDKAQLDESKKQTALLDDIARNLRPVAPASIA